MSFKRLSLIVMGLLLTLNIFGEEVKKGLFQGYLGGVDFIKVFNEGNFISYTTVILFVLGTVLFIIKVRLLFFKEKLDAKSFFLKLKGYIHNENYDEAIKICSNFKETSLGFIFWAGISIFNEGRKTNMPGRELKNSLQNAIDEAALQTVPKIEKGLFWFDLISQASTLLGLLGTIWGLISCFSGLSGKSPVESQKAMTDGIGLAMGATAMGLAVAIPMLFAKGFLMSKATKITDSIDEYSVKLINQLNYSIKD